MSHQQQHQTCHRSRTVVWFSVIAVLLFVVVLSLDLKYELTATGDVLAGGEKELEVITPQQQQKVRKEQDSATLKVRGKAPIEGTLLGMEYFHCPAEKKNKEGNIHNLVLLHGMRFTHEVWKESGILSAFCKIESLQVTAIDFDVKSNYKVLKDTLKALEKEKLVTSLPIDILVTPSASGKSVVTWLKQKDSTDTIQELPKFVKVWMPIASPIVNQVDEATLAAVQKFDDDDFKVVAVHGNQDALGKQSSEKLEKHAKAKVVELKGGHSAYRDSPDDFVVQVMIQLEKKKKKKKKDGKKESVAA